MKIKNVLCGMRLFQSQKILQIWQQTGMGYKDTSFQQAQ